MPDPNDDKMNGSAAEPQAEPDCKPVEEAPPAQPAAPAPPEQAEKGTIRSVGPQFLPAR